MGPHEIEAWSALPERLTIYRGGCSSEQSHAEALREGSRGIFWTPDLESARFYLANRAEQRVSEGNAGWPFLIAADVHRSAVLGMGVFGELTELFVDFDAIDPAGVRCMLPQTVLAA